MIDFQTTRGKLEWVASRTYDPRRSQISTKLTDLHKSILKYHYFPFNIKKNATCYYQDIAIIIRERITIPTSIEDINVYADIINGMYYDIINNDCWGFVNINYD